MTAEEYWASEGVRLLNQDGTIPTVEERVKEAYKKGYATGAEDSEVAIKAMDLWERHKELRENADRIGVNRYEALKKAESEVARLRGLLKDHATFLRKNGFDRQADDLIRFAPAPEEPVTEKDTNVSVKEPVTKRACKDCGQPHSKHTLHPYKTQCPEPAPEWRELGPDEVIQEGDEVQPKDISRDSYWRKAWSFELGVKAGHFKAMRYRTRRPLPKHEGMPRDIDVLIDTIAFRGERKGEGVFFCIADSIRYLRDEIQKIKEGR